MKFDKPIMAADAAWALYDLFGSHGITVWVDGGWGVDALLGRQTRPHSDLDIALRHSDIPKLRASKCLKNTKPIGESWRTGLAVHKAQVPTYRERREHICQEIRPPINLFRSAGPFARCPAYYGRHAELVVNLAGTLASFLASTWDERQRDS